MDICEKIRERVKATNTVLVEAKQDCHDLQSHTNHN